MAGVTPAIVSNGKNNGISFRLKNNYATITNTAVG
jgi:hypothetical protein